MKKLTKSRVSGTVLLGVLFFAAGCGSREEDNLPNYIVNKVQTKTTAGNAQANASSPEALEERKVPTGSPSIIQEDIAGQAEKETENAGEKEESRKDLEDGEYGEETGTRKLNDIMEENNPQAEKTNGDFDGMGTLNTVEDELYVTGIADGLEEEPEAGKQTETGEGLEVVDGAPEDSILEVVASAEEMYLLPAGTAVDIRTLTKQIADCFSFEEVSDTVFERMKGNSYKENCTVALSQLRYVRVLHYDFDGTVRIGELIVNHSIAQEIRDIFLELFEAQYPIEKIVLIDTYGGDDRVSMADNNTTAFNYRVVEGTKTLSKHALGLAVDVNPLYNPYIPEREGVPEVLPENAVPYVDRSAECEYYIKHGDVCYEAFVSRGFAWGGDWTKGKDYQHFSKTP